MKRFLWALLLVAGFGQQVFADVTQRVVDVPSRLGVTQRFLYLSSPDAKAAVILFAGGHGGLNIDDEGGFGWGAGNFLVRTRALFAERGLDVAVIDKPSDAPNLTGRRETEAHVADVRAVMAWLRQEKKLPIWLVGTSRGTQSAAYVATALADTTDSPDGLVLTSTILTDKKSQPVPQMALDRLKIPVLVVHHKDDGCAHCRYADVAGLMDKLTNVRRKDLFTITGGISQGDPCEARAYHGFNGVEQDVVGRVVGWMLAR
jgi:dienelactone hydrolase